MGDVSIYLWSLEAEGRDYRHVRRAMCLACGRRVEEAIICERKTESGKVKVAKICRPCVARMTVEAIDGDTLSRHDGSLLSASKEIAYGVDED